MNRRKIPNFRQPKYACYREGWFEKDIHRTINRGVRIDIRSVFRSLVLDDDSNPEIENSIHQYLAGSAITHPALFLEQFNHFSKKRRNYQALTFMIQQWKEHPKFETMFNTCVISVLGNYYNTKELSI